MTSPVDNIAPTGKAAALIQGINAQAQNGSGWLLFSDESQLLLAEVQRLQALARQAEAMKREIAEKDARIAALETALKPFAGEADGWSSAYPDSCLARTSKSNLGDLRRARSLIGGGNEN
jgi:hypothetical protein